MEDFVFAGRHFKPKFVS